MGWYPPASACGPPPLSPGGRSLRHWRGAGDLNSWGKVEAHAGAAGKLALQPGICGQDRLGVGAMLRACRARSASGVRPCKGLGHATRPKSTRSGVAPPRPSMTIPQQAAVFSAFTSPQMWHQFQSALCPLCLLRTSRLRMRLTPCPVRATRHGCMCACVGAWVRAQPPGCVRACVHSSASQHKEQ